MLVTTTLRKLREANACKDRYVHLRKGLSKNYGDDTPINIITILDINGIDDVLWIPEKILTGENLQRRYRLFAIACCQDIFYLMKDQRSINAVKVAHLYAHGEVNEKDLNVASDAAWDAAWAAWAAWDAAWDAAWAVIQKRQTEHFRIIFSLDY